MEKRNSIFVFGPSQPGTGQESSSKVALLKGVRLKLRSWRGRVSTPDSTETSPVQRSNERQASREELEETEDSVLRVFKSKYL